MKRVGRYFILICLSAMMPAFSRAAVVDFSNDVLKFVCDTDARTASVKGPVDKTLTDLTIPSNIDVDGVDYEVVSIESWAFYGCSSMKRVSLPATLTSIGGFAFGSCTSLLSTAIASLESWCGVTLANGFSNPMFYGHTVYCDGQKLVDVEIPASVTAIGESAFSGCNMRSIVIPSTVKSIGTLAFYGCTGLVSATLPEGMTEIPTSLFDGCSLLSNITIPASVTKIGIAAFNGCSSLGSINIPSSVRTVADDAFAACNSLKRIEIDNPADWCKIVFSNENSNPLVFAHELYCDGRPVKHLVLDNEITAIGNSVFAGCTTLESVTATTALATIGESAFKNCSSLAKVELMPGLTGIGDSAFEGCDKLSEISLPQTLSSLGQYAFYGCGSLRSIEIPAGVAKISSGLFGECERLVSVTFPADVTEIGFGAFFDCTALTELTLPARLQKIGKSAFSGCTGLETVRMGAELANISSFAFTKCDNLKTVVVEAMTPPAVVDNSFSSYTAALEVPTSVIDAYAATDVWKEFSRIVSIGQGVDSALASSDVNIKIESGGLTVEGCEGAQVEVYDLAGHLIAGRSGDCYIALAPGVYIVRVAGATYKVIL